jgi:hypothetical protein
MTRLNGWKRIGIASSVIWILGAGYYTLATEGNRDLKIAGFMNRSCFNDFSDNKDEKSYTLCLKSGEDFVVGMAPVERENAALVALVPVPFAWGGVFLLLFLVRWVRRGFAKSEARKQSV